MSNLGNFVDQSGVTRLRASGGGGGGAKPWESFISGGDSIPSGTNTSLTWTKDDGDDLLDLTNPLAPTVIAAGVYAIFARTVPDNVHAGKFASLSLDPGGVNGGRAGQAFPLDGTGPNMGGTYPEASATIVQTLPAGAVVTAQVAHDIGSNENFYLRAYVQRLA